MVELLVEESLGDFLGIPIAARRNSPRWKDAIGFEKSWLLRMVVLMSVKIIRCLEVVNGHTSHGTLKGSRFWRRGKRRVPRITFAIACFSEDLRGPSLWSSQSRVLCVSSLRSMLVENSHAQIRPATSPCTAVSCHIPSIGPSETRSLHHFLTCERNRTPISEEMLHLR